MTSKKNTRKTIEVDRKRLPLRKLLHGKEIREAAKALEDFRMGLNEAEFLYGAKITVHFNDYDNVYAVAKRPETDKEFEERLERQRIAEEAKKQREIQRKILAEQRKAEEALRQKARIAAHIRDLAKSNNISPEDLKALLNS